jgi:hypothetical protein
MSISKTGKYINIGTYKNIKIGYGTVDFVNLKTIYIKLNSWITPNDMEKNFNSELSLSKRNIKLYISNLKNEYIKPSSIIDFDIRTKGIKANKKSFMNLEITLFVEKYINIKDNKTKELIKNITHNIIDTYLVDKTLFNFNKSKN